MKRNEIILATIIDECRKHQLRLNYAYNKLAPEVPFKVNQELSDEVIAALDQYIFRFSKLQDAIGKKLFKELLQYLGEEFYDKSFLDVFNRLEQLGVIEDYEIWNELRIVRNEIAHEYDENKAELIENCNRIIDSKAKLEKYFNDVLRYIKSKDWNFLEEARD